MIYGYLHQGSGAGNQLHRMIATRIKALDLGVDWRMIYSIDGSGKPEGFKCKDFMEFDQTKLLYQIPHGLFQRFDEKKVVENGVDIRNVDPEFFFIEDGTIIEGEFQNEKYLQNPKKKIRVY